VGLAEALKITHQGLAAQAPRLTMLRNTLIQGVLAAIPGAQLTGHPTKRLPNHASFVFDGVDGNFLLAVLDANGFACSSGSACKVGDPTPSEVLTAIGLSKSLALGSLRVTLGHSTTPEAIESFLDILPSAVNKSRRS
jgi:cysteine desulfurase